MPIKLLFSLALMIAIIAFSIFFVLTYVIYKLYQHPKTNFASRGLSLLKIAFFGDSHIHGRIGDDFVMALQLTRPSLLISNLGHNGDRVKDLLARIDEVKKLSPAQIYLLIGSNDVLAQTPLSEFQDQYKQLVASLVAIAKVFVIAIPMIGDDENDRTNTQVKVYNSAIASIALFYGVKYLPFYEKMAATLTTLKMKKQYDHPRFSRGFMVGIRRYLLGEQLASVTSRYGFTLTVDGLHFNREGSQLLINLIIPELPL